MIFLLDGAFVVLNYFFARNALESSIVEQGKQRKTAYDIALSLTYDNMLQIATYVANDKRIQNTFLRGKNAVENSGSNFEQPEVRTIQKELFSYVESSWRQMTSKFLVRQLHFHLGPGSLSFLRVHRPNKNGDRMDDVRFTIVDTNKELSPRTGFETGRVYSGLRGVVPVFATDPVTGSHVHVGALEAGTSFTNVIKQLSEQLESNVAILLTEKHVKAAMWPQAIESHFTRRNEPCNCYLEATSNNEIIELIKQPGIHATTQDVRTDVIPLHDRHIALSRFALRDYKGMRDPGRQQAGGVFLWWDISREVSAFQHGQQVNLLYAVIVFLAIELLLFFAIRLVTERLEVVVTKRTEEIHCLNRKLYEQANSDSLTGLYNRRYFMQRLHEEISRSTRYHKSFSLLTVDLDHFKQINDNYGHATGDQVLTSVSNAIKESIRGSDISCRFGGEEFCILLPENNLQQALNEAERLRIKIELLQIERDGNEIAITASIGVAVWHIGIHAEELLEHSDNALYQAKQSGRNQVRAYQTSDTAI